MRKLSLLVFNLLLVPALLAACAPAAAPTPAPTKAAAPVAAAATPAAAPAPTKPAVGPSAATAVPAKPAATISAAAPAKSNAFDQLYEAAKKKEGEVIWQASQDPEAFKLMTETFEKRFPGVKLNIVRISGALVVTRLITEAQAKRITLDAASAAIQNSAPLLERNIAAKLDFTGTGVDPQLIGLNGTGVFVRDMVTATSYNTKLLPGNEAPATWDNLLEPKYRNKLVVFKTGDGFESFRAAYGREKQLAFLDALYKQNPIVVSEGQDGLNRIANGEALVSWAGNLDEIAATKAQGAPIDVTQLGPLQSSTSFAVAVKDAPHENAAKLFVTWLGTPEGQKTLQAGQWGTLDPCGPSIVNQMMCGKKFELYRIDSLEKVAQFNENRPAVLRALHLE